MTPVAFALSLIERGTHTVRGSSDGESGAMDGVNRWARGEEFLKPGAWIALDDADGITVTITRSTYSSRSSAKASAGRNPIEFADPIHELAGQMIYRGVASRTIGMSMLSEAVVLLRVAGFNRGQIENAVQDVLSKIQW